MLDSDFQLLVDLTDYLESKVGGPVSLVKRRTYQEISALLLSGQLDAAWICGFPFVQFRDRLALVAVPLYHHKPLYQSYLIVTDSSPAQTIDDLQNGIHAFSDPDSNSGYLVTAYELAQLGRTPATFFRKFFFTYGHRNVVRAVSAGLATSGSVDGYVWDVLAGYEPDLVKKTRVIWKSELLGFPPVACLKQYQESPNTLALRRALLNMHEDATGQRVLNALKLDGFAPSGPQLFDTIAAKFDYVRHHI